MSPCLGRGPPQSHTASREPISRPNQLLTSVTRISHIPWNMYANFIKDESKLRSIVQCHFLTPDRELCFGKEPRDATAIITPRYVALHIPLSKQDNASRPSHYQWQTHIPLFYCARFECQYGPEKDLDKTIQLTTAMERKLQRSTKKGENVRNRCSCNEPRQGKAKNEGTIKMGCQIAKIITVVLKFDSFAKSYKWIPNYLFILFVIFMELSIEYRHSLYLNPKFQRNIFKKHLQKVVFEKNV